MPWVATVLFTSASSDISSNPINGGFVLHHARCVAIVQLPVTSAASLTSGNTNSSVISILLTRPNNYTVVSNSIRLPRLQSRLGEAHLLNWHQNRVSLVHRRRLRQTSRIHHPTLYSTQLHMHSHVHSLYFFSIGGYSSFIYATLYRGPNTLVPQTVPYPISVWGTGAKD